MIQGALMELGAVVLYFFVTPWLVIRYGDRVGDAIMRRLEKPSRRDWT